MCTANSCALSFGVIALLFAANVSGEESRSQPTIKVRSVPVTVGQTTPMTLKDLLGIREPVPRKQTEIYRRGQLTTVIHKHAQRKWIGEPPYGMPVVGRTNRSTFHDVLHTPQPQQKKRPPAEDPGS
jgi:hypothetical protein